MITPNKIEPFSPTEAYLGWTDGKAFAIPYVDLRFECPCAHCIDEHTGKRIVRRETLAPGVRVTKVDPVGRYALQIHFSDGHSTGIYPYERLQKACLDSGRLLHV